MLVFVVVEIELQSSVILLGSRLLVEEVIVDCYLVSIQASQYCIAIWSMSRLHNIILPIWSTSSLQKNIKWLSGQHPGFHFDFGAY